MVNHPMRNRFTRWLDKLEGRLSDDPLRRAAQIALAALDEIITRRQLHDDTGAVAAHEALCVVLLDMPKSADLTAR